MKQKVTTKGAAKKAPKKGKESPVKEVLVELGDRFRKARQDQRLKFEEVSEASGVSTLTISNLEKGKLDNLSLEVLSKIASALGLEFTIEVS